MTPKEKESLPISVEKQYREIGEIIMKDICRRIKKAGEITSTADWQINRLVMMGATTEEIEREIKKRLNISYQEVFKLYDKVIDWEYVRNKDIYEQVNSRFVPYEENRELQQLTKAIIAQTNEELKNISQSLGYAIKMNGKVVFTPLSEYYQKYVDTACIEVATGAVDYNTAIRKTVKQMSDSGMRYGGVNYPSGYSTLIDVAARRAIMTGVSHLSNYIAQDNAKKLGTDYFEVEWHAGARPTHQAWQGKVYSSSELVTICGLGTGEGLNGWNCYHTYYPFIPGISERNWTDEELEQKNQEENSPHEWGGREYTYYELSQKQRQMERDMRAQREYIQGLKYGNTDKADIINAQAKYKGQIRNYKNFCGKFDMPNQAQRVYYDMRGRQA